LRHAHVPQRQHDPRRQRGGKKKVCTRLHGYL
jgi:hypothetical protein